MFLEAGKTKIKTPADSVSDESQSSWVTDSCLLAVPSHGRKGEGFLWGLFLGALILFLNGQHTSVFLPGKSHGQRRLVGYTVHGVPKSQI